MAKPKVFVVQPIQAVAVEAMASFADATIFPSDGMISKAELISSVGDADYIWMLGDTPIDAEVIDAAPDLKGIVTMSLFPNVIDVGHASSKGIPVTIIPHLITKTTCDLTVALIVSLAWRIVEADRFTRSGRFRQEQSTSFLTTELGGKSVGMIGLGEIGSEIAKRLFAFEMNVKYTKRNRLQAQREDELGVTWVENRDDLIRDADFVVVMTTYNPSTHLMFGDHEFSLMKPSAFFVNSARGRIVDERALISALREGRIAGAALDVYWNEPPVSEPNPNPDLFEFDNVILTPHIGSATREARDKMAMAVVDNLRALIDGQRPPNLANPEAYGEEKVQTTDRTG